MCVVCVCDRNLVVYLQVNEPVRACVRTCVRACFTQGQGEEGEEGQGEEWEAGQGEEREEGQGEAEQQALGGGTPSAPLLTPGRITHTQGTG